MLFNSAGRKRLYLVAFLAVPFCWFVAYRSLPDAPHIVGRTDLGEGRFLVELLTSSYVLDRAYPSMGGPRGNHPEIRLHDNLDDDETIWLTGIESYLSDAHTLATVSPEFFCHSNLTFNPDTSSPELHNASFHPPTHVDWRLFTLIPGMLKLSFPDGFGIPVKNGTMLDYYSMVLNHRRDEKREVRIRTRIFCQRGDGNRTLRPLFRRSLYIYQRHEQEASVVSPVSQPLRTYTHQGELCAEANSDDQEGATPSTFVDVPSSGDLHPGATCCVRNASQSGIVDQFGRQNTVHWMVPPGRHRYQTEVTEQLQLPFDTTAHYATGHLHPYGKLIELIEVDTGRVVFHIESRNFPDRLGVEHISEIKSHAGIPLKKNGRYILVSEYENTSGKPIDAMAILYFYALDRRQPDDDSPRDA